MNITLVPLESKHHDNNKLKTGKEPRLSQLLFLNFIKWKLCKHLSSLEKDLKILNKLYILCILE